MDRNEAEKRMATAPVGRLMLQMGTPMILSMMLQAVYNIVDSYFVANMAENGEIAVNALTLAFPVSASAPVLAQMRSSHARSVRVTERRRGQRQAMR